MNLNLKCLILKKNKRNKIRRIPERGKLLKGNDLSDH